jgi:chromosome segregation ATPase
MTVNKAIFGLRFGSNGEVFPSAADIALFLESPKFGNGGQAHGDDTAPFGVAIDRLAAFQQRRSLGSVTFQDALLYGALNHSGFYSAALKSVVEQYKYHIYMLSQLDFKKPTAFVRTAEAEISQLQAARKKDSVRIARLSDMVEERKKTLEDLRNTWMILAAEMRNIAAYVSENLLKIDHLSTASIAVLRDIVASRSVESRLIEDIKTHFKEHLKDTLHQGPIPKDYLDAVRKNVAVLSQELSAVVKEDVESLMRLFEAISAHMRKYSGEIDSLLAALDKGRHKDFEQDCNRLAQIEHALVSLVTDAQFDLKVSAMRSATEHKNLLAEKRRELHDVLMEYLRRERLSWHDRLS